MTNPFAVIQEDLRWLEAAQARIIDNYEACATTDKWHVFEQRENRVRAAERSIRRSMKVYHCVFGGGQSCYDRLVSNCDACVPRMAG